MICIKFTMESYQNWPIALRNFNAEVLNNRGLYEGYWREQFINRLRQEHPDVVFKKPLSLSMFSNVDSVQVYWLEFPDDNSYTEFLLRRL